MAQVFSQYYFVFASDKGEVYAAGDNKCGQCTGGKKNVTVTTPAKVKESLKNILLKLPNI